MPVRTDTPRTLYHAPRTRAFTALWLLEELGLDYRLDSSPLSTGRHKTADYIRNIHPMGKVPALDDGGIIVTETGAMAVYLSDKYPAVDLAPGIGAPERAHFLRWIFFAGSVIEPALAEKLFKWDVPSSSVAWGSFEDMYRALAFGVQDGPWLLGEKFSVADVVVGSSARFGEMFGAFPSEGPVHDYVRRLSARPGFLRASEIEATTAETES
ncbi:MAG: glutathione S-transferase [Myxococcota bacterium]